MKKKNDTYLPKSRVIIKGKINKRSMDKQILKYVWLDTQNNTRQTGHATNIFEKDEKKNKRHTTTNRLKCNANKKKVNRFMLGTSGMVRHLRGPNIYERTALLLMNHSINIHETYSLALGWFLCACACVCCFVPSWLLFWFVRTKTSY